MDLPTNLNASISSEGSDLNDSLTSSASGDSDTKVKGKLGKFARIQYAFSL